MTFQPVVPAPGIGGWRFLQRTYDSQLQTFSGSAQNERETRYFLDNIAKVQTAEDLVSDRRLLRVALGAFGLEGDIDNRYFIRKVLEDGTSADDALANRLSDKRYRQFSEAFGLGPGTGIRTGVPGDMEEIARKNLVSQFEVAVGEADDSMRVALYAQHSLAELAGKDSSETAKWYELMSVPPLRSMMETALALPAAFAQIDIDKQLEVFRDKLSQRTGSPDISQFADPQALETLSTQYLARAQIAEFSAATSSAQTALTLLQGLR